MNASGSRGGESATSELKVLELAFCLSLSSTSTDLELHTMTLNHSLRPLLLLSRTLSISIWEVTVIRTLDIMACFHAVSK